MRFGTNVGSHEAVGRQRWPVVVGSRLVAKDGEERLCFSGIRGSGEWAGVPCCRSRGLC